MLLSLVRGLYPDVPAVFVDTGVEFPEIRQFVRTVDNVVWVKPRYTFKQICEKYGYPAISKETSQKLHEVRYGKSEFMRQLRVDGVAGRDRQRIPAKWQFAINAPFPISHQCCHWLKKEPLFRYEKETGSSPFVGTMAVESSARTQKAAQQGCFVFGGHPSCRPIQFWTPEETHQCLKSMPHCVLYDPPFNFARTGCMFCGYGVHLNTPNKFQMMEISHPRIHEKALPAFGIPEKMEFLGVPISSAKPDQGELF